jgi:hypothetical protein
LVNRKRLPPRGLDGDPLLFAELAPSLFQVFSRPPAAYLYAADQTDRDPDQHPASKTDAEVHGEPPSSAFRD